MGLTQKYGEKGEPKDKIKKKKKVEWATQKEKWDVEKGVNRKPNKTSTVTGKKERKRSENKKKIL